MTKDGGLCDFFVHNGSILLQMRNISECIKSPIMDKKIENFLRPQIQTDMKHPDSYIVMPVADVGTRQDA